MKKAISFLLLFLYLGYLSGPLLNENPTDDNRTNIKLCVALDHHVDLNPCTENDCSQHEFSGRPVLLSHQHHLASVGTRVQFTPLVFLLPAMRSMQPLKSDNDNLSYAANQPTTQAAPVFLLNRVLRI